VGVKVFENVSLYWKKTEITCDCNDFKYSVYVVTPVLRHYRVIFVEFDNLRFDIGSVL